MLCLAAAVLGLALCGEACGAEESPDQRFLAGLRERGLFELAETYCLDRLQGAELPVARRAELVIELSLALTERAVNSAPDEREPLWQRAWGVTDDFARQVPQSPRLPLVRLQGALGLLARGELARQEAEVVAAGGPLFDEARGALREAIRQLRRLADEVEAELRRRSMPGSSNPAQADPDQFTDYQLAALEKNLQYQLARALRNQGQCYADESPDRANSLTQAVALLEPLANLETTHPLAWKSRIDEVVCHRLLADYPTAQRKLDALLAEKPPAPIALHARAEQVRLALAARQPPEAILASAVGREIEGVTSGDLDYALLQVYLAAWRAAGEANDDQKVATFESRATEQVRLIERLHGPYWTRRAEMLLGGYVETSPGGGDLAMQIRAAESLYRSGRYDDALAAYDRAAALAKQQGNADKAFELGRTAAAIEHQRRKHQEALLRYRRLAIAMPSRQEAPEMHLAAVYHAGQIARAEPSGSLDQYVGLLQEHLRTWPDAGTSDEVRWCLGRLYERQRDWQDAIAVYRAISPGFPKYADVVDAAARCYLAWLDERRAGEEPTGEIASRAAEWFESLILGPEQRLPEKWSRLARTAALTAARLWLNYTPAGFARAERILSAALAGADDAPPEWISTARALLVFSLAGQGRSREAAAVLERISAGPPDQLLGMLEGLSRVAATAGAEVRADLADLELRTLELLRPRRAELTQAGQRRLDRLGAQALADAGRIDEALDAYGWLAKTYSGDGEIQEAHARLLLARTDRASLEAAQTKWREVEKTSRPGSDRWFRAKYAVALLHDQLGNRQQAEKMIRLLQILHPEPALRDRQATAQFLESLNPRMKARFLELLRRSTTP